MSRLPAGVPARFVVTDLYGQITTQLARANLLSATYTANLDQPSSGEIDVRSDDPAVNTIFAKDGDPLIAESNRLIYMFLNENPGPVGTIPQPPWVCRAAGILMSPEDETDTDVSTTHFTFYDPWQWLMGIPCFLDDIGTPIGQLGRNFFATPGSQIAAQLLSDSINSLIALGYAPLPGAGGLATMIDMPSPYYTSGHYDGGGVNPTPALNWNVQQGSSVGQAWTNLASAGNDIAGTAQCIDIVIEPVWDPVNRPGYTSQLAVYNLAGTVQPGAPMGWGRLNRALTTADRQHDGTPTSFINVAQFFAGPGGQAGIATTQANAATVAKYRSYWSQQFFPGQPVVQAADALAVQTIQLYGNGKRTFSMNPDPLRAALPFRDYQIGDRIPVYSTNGQRVGASGYQRVESIPIQVNADGVTSVVGLLTSPDWPTGGSGASVSGLTPTYGPAGTAGIDITATAFLPLVTLTVTVGGAAAAVTAGGTTDVSGDATVTFTVPLGLSDGTYPVVVSDGTNTVSSPTEFTVGTGPPPSLSGLMPTFGAAGTTGVTIVASAFLPTAPLTVTVGGMSATVTGGGTTDGSGDATPAFTIPALADGTYSVVVSDGTNTITAPQRFTVGSGPPPGSGAPIGANFNSGISGMTNLSAYQLLLCSVSDAPAAVGAGCTGVLQYGAGLDVNRSFDTGVDWATANANGWLLKDSSGNLLVNAGYPSNNVGDVGDAGYQAAWVSGTLAMLGSTGAFGVWVDDCIRDWLVLTGGGVPAKYPTLADQMAAMQSFIATVGPQITTAGYYFAINASAYTPGDPGSDDGSLEVTWWDSLGGYVSALTCEFYMETSDGSNTLRTLGSSYNQHADGWQPLVETAQNNGCDFIGITYGVGDEYFLYPFTCLLVGWNGGGRSCVMYSPSDGSDPYGTVSPYLTVGTPSDAIGSNPRSLTGGSYTSAAADLSTATGTVT